LETQNDVTKTLIQRALASAEMREPSNALEK